MSRKYIKLYDIVSCMLITDYNLICIYFNLCEVF